MDIETNREEKAEKRAAAGRRFRRRMKKLPGVLRAVVLLKFVHRDDHKEYSRWQFDCAAAEYDDTEAYEMVKADYPEILEELKKEPFGSLLDCGCGTGAVLALLEKEYPDKTFTGIDLSEGMLEIAKNRNLKKTDFLCGDCEELPFPDESFDVVLCSHSFHHYPNPQRFFHSVFRVLRPGGRLILRDNTGDFSWRMKQNYVTIPLNNWKYREGDVRFYSIRQVSRLCKKAGLNVETMEERAGHKLHGTARKGTGV